MGCRRRGHGRGAGRPGGRYRNVFRATRGGFSRRPELVGVSAHSVRCCPGEPRRSQLCGAPIGAEATVCDTRWPVLGLGGVALGAAAPSSPAFLSTVFSANADSLAGLAQPAVGLAALALLSWALAQRLGQERKATTPAEPGTDQLDGSACTTCRPLFPSRGVGASGVGASEPSSEVDPRRP